MKLYNIIFFSFIFPWFIGIFLYFKDKQIILTIAPFSCTVGFILNTIGIDLGYFYPLTSGNTYLHTVTIFPNIGLLSVETCFFIYAIRHTRINLTILNLLVSAISTLIDMIFIFAKLLEYNKGWNIPLSFLVYFVTFIVIYFYYLWIKKADILSNN